MGYRVGNIREKFRIPRHRIIDTAPIAGIFILLSLSGNRAEIITAAAIAMLQVWL